MGDEEHFAAQVRNPQYVLRQPYCVLGKVSSPLSLTDTQSLLGGFRFGELLCPAALLAA
jgi:hypothetical protein